MSTRVLACNGHDDDDDDDDRLQLHEAYHVETALNAADLSDSDVRRLRRLSPALLEIIEKLGLVCFMSIICTELASDQRAIF